ncbi:hypothetical protein ABFS82_11G021000 [Erythranthe guttata]
MLWIKTKDSTITNESNEKINLIDKYMLGPNQYFPTESVCTSERVTSRNPLKIRRRLNARTNFEAPHQTYCFKNYTISWPWLVGLVLVGPGINWYLKKLYYAHENHLKADLALGR